MIEKNNISTFIYSKTEEKEQKEKHKMDLISDSVEGEYVLKKGL